MNKILRACLADARHNTRISAREWNTKVKPEIRCSLTSVQGGKPNYVTIRETMHANRTRITRVKPETHVISLPSVEERGIFSSERVRRHCVAYVETLCCAVRFELTSYDSDLALVQTDAAAEEVCVSVEPSASLYYAERERRIYCAERAGSGLDSIHKHVRAATRGRLRIHLQAHLSYDNHS